MNFVIGFGSIEPRAAQIYLKFFNFNKCYYLFIFTLINLLK